MVDLGLIYIKKPGGRNDRHPWGCTAQPEGSGWWFGSGWLKSFLRL